MGLQPSAQGITPPEGPMPKAPVKNPFDPATLLKLFERLKKESMDQRWVFERDWLRDIYYISNRQWITWHPTRREWIDKRLPKWVPKPVTNKMWETVQSIRTNLIAVQLQAKVRPISNDAESIGAAEVADQMAPLIHEEHNMNQILRESDFWMIVTGNTCLQVSWDLDKRSNRVFIPHEQCVGCGAVLAPQAILDAGNTCPTCQGFQFMQATDPVKGTPIGEYITIGKGKTTSLSPFEYAVPPNVTHWDDIPYIIRLRWRDKHWFEANKPELVGKIQWETNSTDRSLQHFKTLALTNDLGPGSSTHQFGTSGNSSTEGVTEYEVWLKPTPEFPDGLVMRIIGEQQPIVLELPEEGLPGPFPYTDIEGTPLFPFVHAQYEQIGGRLWGRSAISPLIQKQDQLNQLDSLIQLNVQRMANPVWVVPEGAGVEHFSSEPGLIMKWNPLAANGQAKPERISGEDVPQSLMVLREQIEKDIEELAGTFDIIKGQKPTGVEAFSALQLLVERSQSRFTAVFQARGEMYRRWFSLALELERQFGPQQRTQAVVGPNRGYTFQHFENAQLQGQVTVMIEDGSTMPKTKLGERAAIEQGNQLMLLNPADPEQRWMLLSKLGLTDLVPTLNYHVQTALQIQDAFEQWAQAPMGIPPLVFKPWHDPQIHYTERIKWLNTDKMRELLVQHPEFEPYIIMHLQELQMMMMPAAVDPMTGQPMGAGGPISGAPGAPQQPPMGGGAPPQGGSAPGGGQAMTNSNTNSASTGGLPKGNQSFGPNVGPS